MLGMELTATGPESVARTVYLRKALDDIENAVLNEAKQRLGQMFRLGDTPEDKAYNDGIGAAMNVIGDMEAGR